MTDVPNNSTTELRSPVIDALNTLKWWTLIVTVILGLAIITSIVIREIDLGHVEESAVQTKTALCALRADLRKRVENAEDFLQKNPEGIVGISARQIQKSINQQRRTIDTLTVINCTEINGERKLGGE